MNDDLIEALAERHWKRMTRSGVPYAEIAENDKRAARAFVRPILADVLELTGAES